MSLIRRTTLPLLASCLALMIGSQTPFAGTPEGLGDASNLRITGALSYRARIALPPDALAIVELRDPSVPGGRLVAEQRIALDGRQVPIPFELVIERAEQSPHRSYSIRGAVLSGGSQATND